MKKCFLIWIFLSCMCVHLSQAQQWSLIGQAFTNSALNGPYFLSADTGYAVSSAGRIAITKDGGVSWGEQAYVESPLNDIFFINDNIGYACGFYGKLLFTNNGGNTWDYVNWNFNGDLYCLYFLDENMGFVGASNGIIYRTINGGISWESISTNTSDIRRISFIGDQVSFAVKTFDYFGDAQTGKSPDHDWKVYAQIQLPFFIHK